MSGLLVLSVDSPSGTITLPSEIPAQKITLKQYRVQLNTAANALANGVIWVNIPWAPNSIIYNGNNTGHTYSTTGGEFGIPLALDNQILTIRDANLSFSLPQAIPRTFNYNMISWATDTTAGGNCLNSTSVFKFATMTFEYSVGEIV